ncbi:MAG: LysR family transcriptional regulator [Rhizobiaceae bacterium]
MNETKLNWADLQLFIAVARGRGLAAGARITGMSAPSLGRHMADLERSYGETLFRRLPRGYELTAAGEELLQQAVEVEERVLNIERRRDNRRATLPVHISAGTWTMLFLAGHIGDIRSDDTRLVLHSSEQPHDISRRETTIGIRNARPDEPALVARKTGHVAFAPYATPAIAKESKWLASSVETPSANWVRSHRGRQVVMEVSNPRSLLDLAKQGVGQAVLPCFIGECEAALVRSGEIIDELTGDQWLVVHGEDRNQPQVRRTINAITKLLVANAGLFAGKG